MIRLLLSLLILLVASTQAKAEKRVALVIGNSGYQSVPELKNPLQDAPAIGNALEELGFDVSLGIDLPHVELTARIRSFGIASEGADLALFYYAGHGLQVDGKNYLLPIDASVERKADLDFVAIDLQLVLKQLEQNAVSSVILLDACRDNPFDKLVTRSFADSGGLARVDAAGGTFIGFATEPGNVALDGVGDHSPFTAALLEHMGTPGLEINSLMTRVRAEVFEQTGEQQLPWTNSSLLHDLYLVPASEQKPDPGTEELRFWQSTLESGTEEAIRTFLGRFPDGRFSEQAEQLLRSMADLKVTPDPIMESQDVGLAVQDLTSDEDTPVSEPDAPILPNLQQILGGDFRMGDATDAAIASERPLVDVTLKGFSISRTEVTVEEFQSYLESTGRDIPLGCYVWTAEGRLRWSETAGWQSPGIQVSTDMPVSCVNWDDAQNYTEWLTSQTGKMVRLPSEAELEFVIRAGSTGQYPFDGGAEAACGFVNGADASSRFNWRNLACEDGFPGVAGSGALPPNAFGLYGTTGNLWEWAADCWNPSHAGASSDGSPRLQGQCQSRVLRGGSWDDPIENLRSSYRVGIPKDRRQANVGFRIVVEN